MAKSKKNKKKKNGMRSALKWGAAIAGGAVVGAIAVDKYREMKGPRPGVPGGVPLNPAQQAMSALFAGPVNPFDAAPSPQINVFTQPTAPPNPPAPPEPPPPPEPDLSWIEDVD